MRLLALLLLSFALQAQTPLHDAAAKCDLETARRLVEAGSDRLARDASGKTPYMLAQRCPLSESTQKLVRLLYAPPPAKRANESARWSLQDAAARGNLNVVEMLLKLGTDVNAVGSDGNRALEIASRNGHAEVVKALVEAGADPKLSSTAGSTPLHEAALGGKAAVMELLLDRGADINAPDAESGATPLHYAASFGRVDAVRTLLRRGAARDRKNNKGETPLEAAVANGQPETAALLKPR